MSRLAEALARANSSAQRPAAAEKAVPAPVAGPPALAPVASPAPVAAPPVAAQRAAVASRVAVAPVAPEARVLVRAPKDLLTQTGPVRINPELVGKLVGSGGMLPGCIEQYRKVAASLHHMQLDRNMRVLLVSSAVAGEGKTLTTTNIALTLSQSYGRRVLVIDCDLRRPTMHSVFDLPNTAGLSDGLRAEHDRKLPLTVVGPRLAVLTAGRPDSDPMSGLTSPRMARIIEEATAVFDWVLIDTPPIGLLPDARLLADKVDGALLVIHAGKSPVQLISQAVDSLGRDRIMGVVMNGVRTGDAGARSFYGYGYGYGYGSYGPRPGEPVAGG